MFYLYTRLIRPMLWLGLVEESQRRRYGPLDEMKVRRTKLFDRFVRVEPESLASVECGALNPAEHSHRNRVNLELINTPTDMAFLPSGGLQFGM